MALSSTAAALYISSKNLHLPTLKNSSILSNPTSLGAPKQRRLIRIRSSGTDASPETQTPVVTEAEPEQNIDEAPKGPPSLISALNVERALRGIAITDADHYGRLGLPRGCSYEQVEVAYKNKVDELLNEGLDQEELTKKMDLLRESYSILPSKEERRMYDWSLARSEQPDRYAWPFEVDIPQTNTEDPPPQEPEDVGPTIWVGYFMLGWLILSFVLSIALAR